MTRLSDIPCRAAPPGRSGRGRPTARPARAGRASGAVGLALAVASASAASVADAAEMDAAAGAPAVSYARLSDQATAPFRFGGKVLDEDHPGFDDYGDAIRRFPDVRSCLKEEARDAARPDLARFDWKAMRSTKDAEVCVFRVAASVGEPERFADWLRSQGVESIVRIDGIATGSSGDVIVSGKWPVKEKGALLGLGNVAWRALREWLSYALSVNARYHRDGFVLDAEVGYQTK